MTENKVVVADSGVIISLAVIDKISIFESIFKEVYIPEAVWNEINSIKNIPEIELTWDYFKNRVKRIKSINNYRLLMDYGESEAILLYQEIDADFLLIDDKHARIIAETLDIKCIGTLGILIKAKEKKIIKKLRPLFQELLMHNRYFSLDLLNTILRWQDEQFI